LPAHLRGKHRNFCLSAPAECFLLQGNFSNPLALSGKGGLPCDECDLYFAPIIDSTPRRRIAEQASYRCVWVLSLGLSQHECWLQRAAEGSRNISPPLRAHHTVQAQCPAG